MSRTYNQYKNRYPSRSKDYWSRRPYSNRHGCGAGPFAKSMTHKLERILKAAEIEDQLNERDD